MARDRMGSGGKTIAEGQSPGNGVRSRGGAGTPARQQQGEVRAPDDPVAIEVDAGLRTPPGGEQEGEGDGDEKGTPWKRTQSARGSVCQTRQRLRPWLTNCQKCVAPLSTFERYGWAIGTTKIK